ncbi:MAG: ECF transporter S component [Bacillota bacterium]|nr:ECF transporter S component [Bacillota bacterium]
MKTKKINTVNLALMGIFTALIIILTFTPIGMITVGTLFTITTVHIPVIIGGIVLGPRFGTALGAIMGFACEIRAAVFPVSITDPLFINPIISVIPRILLGFVAAGVFYLLAKYFQKTVGKVFAIGLSALLGTATNTIFVLGALAIIYPVKSGLSWAFASILFTNFLFEALAAIILSVPISLALFYTQKRLVKYN